MMKATVAVIIGIVLINSVAILATERDAGSKVVDPGCYLDSYVSRCQDVSADYFRCKIKAVFKHYDADGNPLALSASVKQKCIVQNYLFSFIKISCAISDSGHGHGTVTLRASRLINYGTDYDGVCYIAPGYPEFHCSD